MPIVFGNINPVSASSTGIQTVDNGLTANTPTNAELGGVLTLDTLISLVTFFFQINGGGVNFKLTPGANPRVLFSSTVGSSSSSFSQGQTFWQIVLNHGANVSSFSQFQNNPIQISEAETSTGLVYNFNYNTNQLANNRAITDVGGVKSLITSSGGAIFALIAGQVFTGNISAPNLSGTNTGDQNLTPYALLLSPAFTGTPTAPTAAPGDNSTQLATTAFVAAVKALCALLTGATFTGAISATNLSGTNTGDQNLTPYALLAGAAFTGAVTAPKALNTIVSANFVGITATQIIFSVTSAPAVTVYRVNLFYQITAFTAGTGTLTYTYTDINGTPTTTTVTVGNSVGNAGLSPRIFAAKASTPINATLTIAGGAQTASIGGSLELLY